MIRANQSVSQSKFKMDPPPQNPPQDQVESTESKAKVHTLHTGGKILILSKNHILKFSIFPKFTILKSHFSQNSHFQNLIFHKINFFKASFFTKFTYFKVSFFTKFTFFKHQILGNLWIKSWFFAPVCQRNSRKLYFESSLIYCT